MIPPIITGRDLEDLKPTFISLQRRLRQNIIDEMPTGRHSEQAAAWRRLAERCLSAARKHEAVVEKRQATRAYLTQFAPEYRQTAFDAKYKGDPDAQRALDLLAADEAAKAARK